MVLDISEYNAAYFGDIEESGGLKHEAGYSNYLLQVGQKSRFDEGVEPYNPTLKSLMDKLKNEDLSNVSVLDIGGAVGFHSEYGKKLGIKSWTILDGSEWASRHLAESVDNFILGDARSEIVSMRTNEYDVIFTSRFLECVPESDLNTLVNEMNRVSKKKQIHVITENANSNYYTSKSMSWWSGLPFESGTILISYDLQQTLVI